MWFHTTNRLFVPGDFVLPAAVLGIVGRWPNAEHYDPSYVYIWTENADIECICLNYGLHIYEVTPRSDIEPDPDYRGGAQDGYGRIRMGRVVREWSIAELNERFRCEIDNWFDYEAELHGTVILAGPVLR